MVFTSAVSDTEGSPQDVALISARSYSPEREDPGIVTLAMNSSEVPTATKMLEMVVVSPMSLNVTGHVFTELRS